MPRAWKIADVPPLLKAPTIYDINKDIRPISLTSTLSKVAEGFVIDMDRLSVIDPSQFGFIPGSCTTFDLISMFHQWLRATCTCTCFKRTPPCFSQVATEGVDFEIVSSAKVLGVVSNGLSTSTQLRLRLPRDFIS